MSIQSGFWFLAGALCATAVWLLLGRSWQSLRSQSRWLLGGSVVAVLAALALYSRLGSPELLTGSAGAPAGPSAASGAHPAGTAAAAGAVTANDKDAGSMEAVVASLEARLRAQGGGDGDWELLAKSYEFLNRADAAALARAHKLPAAGAPVAASPAAPAAPVKLTAESERLLAQAEAARQKRDFKAAEKIFAQLAARSQMTAQSWADYADVAASLNGNSLNGKPMEYVQRALQLDPAHPKALWLQGSVEHETGRYAAAVNTWQRLLAVMDANSSDAKLIRGNIEEDTRLAGAAVAPARQAATQAPSGAAAGGLSVRGDVTVSPSLQSRVRAGQVLYIVAKSVNSPGMPVAVRRVETGAWPVRFELSDSDAMIPERRLSSVGPVTVEARVSQSGQANSAPGDLLGATAPLDPAKAGALHIVIDREVR